MWGTPSVADAANRLNAPVYALPVDVFRVLTGVVILSYFVHTFVEAPDFTSVSGLIDHELTSEIFPFTGIGLFSPRMTLFTFRSIFVLAIFAAAVGLILGYRPKVCATILYLIAVSTYRWNFFVMYVDDAIMHLMLFWMLLLPIGNTLVLGEWLAGGRAAWIRWKSAAIPGAAVRCFVANLALIYLVAGLWKWTSAMWREGIAVYAILKTPLSYAPDWWGVQHLGFLMPLNYLALVCEPMFAVFCVFRLQRPLRYLILCALAGFHIFILATMKVPFANVACLAAAVVLVRDDLMRLVHRGNPQAVEPTGKTSRGSEVFAVAFVVVLALSMLTAVTGPDWRRPVEVHQASVQLAPPDEMGGDRLAQLQRVFLSALWAVGIAQQYQLLNWIDKRNFEFIYEIEEVGPDGRRRPVDSELMFPGRLRSVLLQSNLHGAVWVKVSPQHLTRLREDLQTRFASRYCRLFQPVGRILVNAGVRRTGVSDGKSSASPSFHMDFVCKDGQPVFVR